MRAPLVALLFALLVAPTAAFSVRSAVVASQTFPPNISSMTYGDLAALIVPPAWDNVIALLPTLSPTVMPADVKSVRKAILALRNSLDVFSYAYSDNSPTFNGDPLPNIRDLLDAGYETIGHFRDLQESGVNYTKKELITRRCECLIWEADFEENAAEHSMEAYVDSPLLNKLELDRKSSHLSSFFWRNTDFVPKEKDTGLHTVSKLEKKLLEIAEADYDPLVKLDDLTKEDQQATMHDYRKQLRGILFVGAALPLWDNTAEPAAAVKVLTAAYDGLGNCEDAINAYVFEMEHGNKASQEAAKNALDDMWTELLQQLDEDGLVDAEKTLVDSLINY